MKRDLGREIWKYAAGASRDVFPSVVAGAGSVVGGVIESPPTYGFTETFSAPTPPTGQRQLTHRPIVGGSLEIKRTSDGFVYLEGGDYTANLTTGVITNLLIPGGTNLTAGYFYYSTSGGQVGAQGPAGPIGPIGPAGPAGTPGTNGSNAYTTVTADFIQPAEGANVVATVADTRWMGVGQGVFNPNGGYYAVVFVNTLTTVTLMNVGEEGASPPGSTIPAGSIITAAGTPGPVGPQGPAGTNGVWRGVWNAATSYILNDIVYSGGSSWIALAPNTNSVPSEANANWGYVAKVGATGAQGNPGPQGSQGPAGPTGAQGPQGIPGNIQRLLIEATPMPIRPDVRFRGTGWQLQDNPQANATEIRFLGGGTGGGGGGSARYVSLLKFKAV